MELVVKRVAFRSTYTVGCLYVDHKFFCDTFEPRAINWAVEKKIPGRTAVPEGIYSITLALSQKFLRLMPYLKGVPEFQGVMFHWGNYPRHTTGCILVGDNTDTGKLFNSKKTFLRLFPLIADAVRRGEKVSLRITSVKEWTYTSGRKGE
ncbi:MAG: DUF5675 family protein [Bacteroides sp.]|nr:DUF5675 family protein [Roseburia sp.]MCM1346159.1 DUF5675 family protein [Bacteroides sp.]MCM1420962.1 DUF5675 family protein [Bacteroides sp.]